MKQQDYYCDNCDITWTAAWDEYCGCAQWYGDETDVCPKCGREGTECDGVPEPEMEWER